MITKRTKIQLLIFVFITVIGVSYVGARYAQLDRYFHDATYTVVADFETSGGIYEGAEVNYRGVKVGKVGEMILSEDGVEVRLDIENGWDDIPADATALVGNRSAVGEQYVEIQPQTNGGPYLGEGSRITETETPISTEKLLTDTARTLASVDREALVTTIDELGKAFAGVGPELANILETTSSFIETADENFVVTRNLLHDSNTVLEGQLASESSIRSFADDMELFTGTLRGATPDLVKLIENGSASANQVRTFLEQNQVDLSQLLNRAATTGEVVYKHLDGIEHLLVVYPAIVEGTFGVVARDPATGLYNAHFGLALTSSTLCENGYGGTQQRTPYQREDMKLNAAARCADAPGTSNPRGAQNAPRAATNLDDVPVVASYDRRSGEVEWGETERGARPAGTEPSNPPPATLGEDSWTWLYLEPLSAGK